MPRMPKWLADTSEKLFSKHMHPVRVTAVSDLDKKLRKVRFEGDLSQTNYQPGNVVEFRINDTEFRHYTPSFFDRDKGICEVVFYLHDLGPGSRWVKCLEVGNQLKLMGPGGKISLKEKSSLHILIGDETSLGFCKVMSESIGSLSTHYLCLLELHKAHVHWPELLGVKAKCFLSDWSYPASGILSSKELSEVNHQNASFYLTGRAKSIQKVRRFLKEKGVANKQILTEPYWAEGKVGL